MDRIHYFYKKQMNSGMIFPKRELPGAAAEEASQISEVDTYQVKLSGKRTGKRTTF